MRGGTGRLKDATGKLRQRTVSGGAEEHEDEDGSGSAPARGDEVRLAMRQMVGGRFDWYECARGVGVKRNFHQFRPQVSAPCTPGVTLNFLRSSIHMIGPGIDACCHRTHIQNTDLRVENPSPMCELG